jgi:glycosyltransferase involved in cell wall biosynthesis
MTLFVHAPNVHQGGGRTLLVALLDQLDHTACCVLDERMPIDNQALRSAVHFIKPTLVNRFGAEILLFNRAKIEDTVLCFGNLPPLFKSQAKVFVFLQNRYLFGVHDFSRFPFGSRVRLMLERWWFRTRMRANYQIIVQSPTMQRELKRSLGFDALVLPFLAVAGQPATTATEIAESKQFDFVYISSAEPHKNHLALLDAWVVMAEQGIRPTLALTVSEQTAAHVAQLIEQKKSEHGLKITNFGTLQHGEVHNLYRASRALIFPSKLESFGLPLLEATKLGMPVLAPELDYVRDVIEPAQTFDPNSPTSIARAVLRHLNIPVIKTEIIDSKAFLAHVMQQGKP